MPDCSPRWYDSLGARPFSAVVGGEEMTKATLAGVLICLVGLGLVFALLTRTDMGSLMRGNQQGGTQSAGITYGYGGNHKDPEQVRLANLRAELRMAHWEDASPHHWRVVGWVLKCSSIGEVSNLPPYLREFFNPLNTDDKVRPTTARLPHRHEMALVQLSRAIGDHRVSLATKSNDTFSKAGWATFATVILGFITTIVVSFNSSSLGQGEGRLAHFTRFLAIVLTASGTALAAIIAFYNPQGEWHDTKRLLSSLAELHNFVALETWKLDCLELDEKQQPKAGSNGNRLIMQRFEEWTKRYHDLQSTLGSVNPSASSPGAGPTPLAPAKEIK